MLLFPSRRYDAANPPRWCVWRWRPIHAAQRAHPYLLRLYVWMTSWFSLCIHWIRYPDPDLDPHDHQRAFFSIVLRGGYIEELYERDEHGRVPLKRTSTHVVRWYNRKGLRDVHRIIAVERGTITLVFNGRRAKDWYFYVAEPGLPCRSSVAFARYDDPVRASS